MANIRSAAAWEALFLGVWTREHPLYWAKCTSGDSFDLYNLAYALDGLAALFEATGKTSYLDRALLYINGAIAAARPSSTLVTSQFRDGYRGWVTRLNGSSGEQGLYESYCWRYVTRLLRLLKANAAVYTNPVYRRQFDAILAFTEAHIFDKWWRRSPAWIYRANTHMAAHWAYIALNLARLTASPTRQATCVTIAHNINFSLPGYPPYGLRDQLVAHPMVAGGLFWNWNWGQSACPGSDVSHGGNTVAYLVEATEQALPGAAAAFTASDMAGLVVTLDKAIWKSAGAYAYYVDGTGTGNGWFSDGWCKLGRYSIPLQQRLEGHTVGRGMQFYGNGVLNARRLGG